MHQPKISIITTTYNSAKTIRDTLSSVAKQTYPNIEHIIIDGSSTDNTIDIVKSFCHVKIIISEKDRGIYDAMNKGIKVATGDIIGILNSDDFYTDSNVISDIVNQFNVRQCDSIYADLVYIANDDINNIVRVWQSNKFNKKKFLYGWMPPHPTFFVKKKIYTKYGLYNLTLKQSADYELMLRFLYKEGISVSYLPKIIVKMRVGGHSTASLKNRIKANREDLLAWKINHLIPQRYTIYLKPLRKIYQFIKPIPQSIMAWYKRKLPFFS